MRGIRARTTKGDTTRYDVQYRDADGRLRSAGTVGSAGDARKLRDKAEKYGKLPGHEGVIKGTHHAPGWRGGKRFYDKPTEIVKPAAARNSIEDFMGRFLAEHGYRGKSGTEARSIIRVHLIPAFGRTPMNAITASDTTSFIRKLEDTHLTARPL